MKHIYLLVYLIPFLGFGQTVPPELQSYYSGVDFTKTGMNLYDDLAIVTISSHSPFLTYSERHDYLYDADEDPSNANNVILIYSGESRPDDQWLSGSNPNPTQTYNTEHVYPRSLLDTGTAEADLHVLRVCDIDDNSLRANDPFTDGMGNFSSTGTAFFPGDDWRGDVARIIMYTNLRYNEPFTDVGTLNLFLEWNAEDPVSPGEIEDNRNTVISGAQGNRNPFIDNPYLATIIWGGSAAEDRWGTLSSTSNEVNKFNIYPNPTQSDVTVQLKSPQRTSIEVYDILGKKVLHKVIYNSEKIETSRLKSGVYILKIRQGTSEVNKRLVKR